MEQILEPRMETARVGSAASWSAIIAGAFVAASVSLVLLALGSGLGFASISPWPGHGVGAKAFAITTAIWLIVMQWISSGLGGYITGRLRTKWSGTHTHEVFFRDTAHGLVMWAVATVLVAATLATSVFSVLGSGARAASGVASGAASSAAPGSARSPANVYGPANGYGGDQLSYGVDKLFRGAGPAANGQASIDPRVEVTHIVANSWSSGTVPDADRSYLTELVATRAGVPAADARTRVDDFIASVLDAETKAKAEADAARKTAAQAAIYTALSMLVGAFIASVSAALGGRLRDEHL
jgi:hypothetical protein